MGKIIIFRFGIFSSGRKRSLLGIESDACRSKGDARMYVAELKGT